MSSASVRHSEAPTAAKAKLAVIIPMYNEEQGAERCVREVCAVLSREVPDAKLFVVNDGSKDDTKVVLQALAAFGFPFCLVSYSANRGYGSALLVGAAAALEAGFDFGLFMDSDLTNDPALIPQFERAIQGPVDVVKASRYIESGGMRGVPLYRQMITRTGNKLASVLFGMGIKDCTNGFRAVRLAMLRDKQGARATEIPYILTSREEGGGKSKFRYNASTFYRYLKYCVKAAFVRRRQGASQPV
jgi:dolichol-phosphate mannosyltransferase